MRTHPNNITKVLRDNEFTMTIANAIKLVSAGCVYVDNVRIWNNLEVLSTGTHIVAVKSGSKMKKVKQITIQ